MICDCFRFKWKHLPPVFTIVFDKADADSFRSSQTIADHMETYPASNPASRVSLDVSCSRHVYNGNQALSAATRKGWDWCPDFLLAPIFVRKKAAILLWTKRNLENFTIFQSFLAHTKAKYECHGCGLCDTIVER